MAAPEPADVALDPTLLVGIGDPWSAEEGVEAVVGAAGDESFGLGAVASLHHPHYRGPEVVVADHGRDPTEVGERLDVAVEERLLRLGGTGDVERQTRVRQPHDEHVALDLGVVDRGVELPEVDLGLRPGLMGLRGHHLYLVQAQLVAADGDEAGDRHL